MKTVYVACDGRAYKSKSAAKTAENTLFEVWIASSEFAEKVKTEANAEFGGDLDFPVHEMIKTLFFDKIVDIVSADSLGIPHSKDSVDLSLCTF